MNLFWTRQASAHLDEVVTYMAEAGSISAAVRQLEAIVNAAEQLRDFPELGRPGRIEGTRELVVQRTPYIVAYRVRAGAVRILAVIHGARRWPAHV